MIVFHQRPLKHCPASSQPCHLLSSHRPQGQYRKVFLGNSRWGPFWRCISPKREESVSCTERTTDQEPHMLLRGMYTGPATVEVSVEGSQNTSHGPSTWSSYTPPGISPKDSKPAHHRDPCLSVFTATLFMEAEYLTTKAQPRKMWKWILPEPTILNECLRKIGFMVSLVCGS